MALSPNPVNWFEIPVSDMQRAIKFYGEAFDIKLEPIEMGPQEFAFFPMQKGAVGAGGTITGYGAGKHREGFGGAIIIDEPEGHVHKAVLGPLWDAIETARLQTSVIVKNN